MINQWIALQSINDIKIHSLSKEAVHLIPIIAGGGGGGGGGGATPSLTT